MKLKYYLRGLGIGIVVTAVVMSFTGKKEELTDAEIKFRAAQLGMVEKNVLADIQKEKEDLTETNKEEDIVESVPENDDTIVAENNQDTIEHSEETVTSTENTETEEPLINIEEESISDTETEPENVTEEPEEESNPDADNEQEGEIIQEAEKVENYIIIKVERGNGSEIVSRRVFEAGLVNSASDYNKYLVSNGYDRRLRVGNHEIPADATEEEIAKILCGMK